MMILTNESPTLSVTTPNTNNNNNNPVVVRHEQLHTTFAGVSHALSTPEATVHQFFGIKYADVPARFRQSMLCSVYPPVVDATHYGPICPQPKYDTLEAELFGLTENDLKHRRSSPNSLRQDEFECLNLNVTCPPVNVQAKLLPVMVWIHGGGNRGSGSSWLFDGGSLVRKSISDGKPIILVTINYRLGLLGFASSPALRDDNQLAGDEGVGNYGLRDQRVALEWVHNFISGFGGDPSNITLFGESTGATDILCHLHSTANERHSLFHRAIVQSAMLEADIPTTHTVGWQLSRLMDNLNVHSIEELRALEVEKLTALGHSFRATDDGVFFAKGWREALYPSESETTPPPAHHHHHHRPTHVHLDVPERPDHRHLRALSRSRSHSRSRSRSRTPNHPLLRHPVVNKKAKQPLMIGDCGAESLHWTLPASLWTAQAVIRRIRAICQSLNKSTALLRAYDITPLTPDDELCEHLLELINDTRFAWPVERIAQFAKLERGGREVFRYVFDQESAVRGTPHHAVDLMYLFDNVPLPALASATPPDSFVSDFGASSSGILTPLTPEMCFGSDSSSDEDEGKVSLDYGFGGPAAEDLKMTVVDESWGVPVVDEYSYTRVRDAMQSRWITFANGESPWSEDKVYVFGPEGETGERSMTIFGGRRRTKAWKQALEPLGMQMVHKVGVELCGGPPMRAPVKAKVKLVC